MNSDNFNKLFTEDHKDVLLAQIGNWPTLKEPRTKSEIREIIEREHKPISPELDEAIQRFIKANKGHVHGNQLRAMVRKHFGITVV